MTKKIFTGLAIIKKLLFKADLVSGTVPATQLPWSTSAQITAGTPGLAIAPDQLAAVPVKLGAWTAYTPTVTPLEGAFTNVTATGRWTQIGKTVSYSVRILIVDKGSAGNWFTFSLPIACQGPFVNLGKERVLNGKALSAVVDNPATRANPLVTNDDDTTCLINGATLVISGIYEAA